MLKLLPVILGEDKKRASYHRSLPSFAIPLHEGFSDNYISLEHHHHHQQLTKIRVFASLPPFSCHIPSFSSPTPILGIRNHRFLRQKIFKKIFKN
jgi:hypothetical protein